MHEGTGRRITTLTEQLAASILLKYGEIKVLAAWDPDSVAVHRLIEELWALVDEFEASVCADDALKAIRCAARTTCVAAAEKRPRPWT